jgi:acyl-CoA synthetase (NDP forming)
LAKAPNLVTLKLIMPTANDIISLARREARTVLTEPEAKSLLGAAGIPVNRTDLAADRGAAVAAAEAIGYPVVLKIVSPDIVHKSDVGGVALNLATSAAVEAAYDDMMARLKREFPQAELRGVSVQPQAPDGLELIVGMSRDAQFGPVIMFGLGGIFVEVIEDVVLRLVPLKRRDAREMLAEIKGAKLLGEFRGRPPVDRPALEDLLLKLSDFIAAHPEISQIDLNPVLAYPDGAIAVDARVILENAVEAGGK